MKTVIGGITIDYPEAGAPVKISGEGTLKGIELFEAYSVSVRSTTRATW